MPQHRRRHENREDRQAFECTRRLLMRASLHREAFRTSRLLEFCNRKELIAQTGHHAEEWPLVILKELVDNAIDIAEEAAIAPEITIQVSTETSEITVADNGPGILPDTVKDILDYTVRVSSREAYVSPTRGAQGNALKTLVAMPYALDGKEGVTVIAAQGITHIITFRVDHLRQEPVLDHDRVPSPTTKGTRITIKWPNSACLILAGAESRFLQIADDFAWVNPHLRIRVEWNGSIRVDRKPSNPAWQKWRPSDPTSAHWYDAYRLERYVAAHVSHDRDLGRDRTVREFISELRGFSGSAKQKLVLDETGMARASLSSLFSDGGEPKRADIERLLGSLKKHSKSVKPQALGLIGQDHLRACFEGGGVHPETFKYKKVVGIDDAGLPCVLETAFGYCPNEISKRRIIAGANWSVGIGNPFRSFGRHGEGLESLLAEQRARYHEPIVFVAHFACPRIEYTDRGKSALVIRGEDDAA
jgi:DNA topoisomerase VI subunit B